MRDARTATTWTVYGVPISELSTVSDAIPNEFEQPFAANFGLLAQQVIAQEFRKALLTHYPSARVTFDPNPARQAIVDSWPADVDDSRARADWGFAPRFDLPQSLRDELVPALTLRYPARATT